MFGWLPWRGRLLDSCFRISSRPDMNSRAAGRRSHRSRIRSREAVSERNGGIEAADEGKQRRVGHGLIPVIENAAERRLTPHAADDGAEDDRHPAPGGQASAEADAAQCRENNQDDRSQQKASDHLGSSQFTREGPEFYPEP